MWQYEKLTAKAAIMTFQAVATVVGLLADNPTRQALAAAMQASAEDLQKEYLEIERRRARGI